VNSPGPHVATLILFFTEAVEFVIEIHSEVEVNVSEGQWLKGKISRVRLNGTYDIDYADGDFERGIPKSMLRSARTLDQLSNLSMLCEVTQFDICQLLLVNGADPNLKDKVGS
jgi:hypothetical protein